MRSYNGKERYCCLIVKESAASVVDFGVFCLWKWDFGSIFEVKSESK